MIISALRWVSFLWAVLALGAMAYFVYSWSPSATEAELKEVRLGFNLALYCGSPAWVTLPIVGLAQRASLPRWQFYCHLLLPIAAGLFYLWGRSL